MCFFNRSRDVIRGVNTLGVSGAEAQSSEEKQNIKCLIQQYHMFKIFYFYHRV